MNHQATPALDAIHAHSPDAAIATSTGQRRDVRPMTRLVGDADLENRLQASEPLRSRRLTMASPRPRTSALELSTTLVGGRPVRSFSAGEAEQSPELVMLPGLGAPGYLVPWAHRIAQWTKVTIVDLPGWRLGHRGSCDATVDGIATAVLAWLAATARDRVILLGHSTGANAALRAALRDPDRLTGVVLAGPTFEPAARKTLTLIRRAVATFAHEVPAELAAVGPSYLASGILPLLRLIRSGQLDRPEDHVAGLAVPSLFVTGQDDGFAPPHWARYLAYLACTSCVVLPGGHNACFPFPDKFDAALRDGVGWWRSHRRPGPSGAMQ